MEVYAFPEATAAFTLPTGEVNAVAIGFVDIKNQIPMLPQTRMLAASICKKFVGTIFTLLEHNKEINFDNKIFICLNNYLIFNRIILKTGDTLNACSLLKNLYFSYFTAPCLKPMQADHIQIPIM